MTTTITRDEPGWHCDGHMLTVTLHGTLNWIRLAVTCPVDGRTPTVTDPCRVHFAEDGTATGRILDYCEFAAWIAADGPLSSLHRPVSDWPVGEVPLPIACRWTGDGYEWAPAAWVASRTGGVR